MAEASTDGGQTIIALESTNIKRVKAVRLRLEGKRFVVIGGRNEAGKSSVLDSVEYALGGKPDIGKPIRSGQEKAEIIVETERLIITRRFTKSGGTSLTVSRKLDDGTVATLAKPQAILDELVGDLAFDPLEFARMTPVRQAEILRRAMGVDVRELDARAKTIFAERRDVNRTATELQAQLVAMPLAPDGTPDEETSLSELSQHLTGALLTQQTREDRVQHLALCDNKIAELQETIAGFEADKVACRKTLDTLPEPVNIEELRTKLNTAEADNTNVRTALARRRIADEYDTATETARGLTVDLETIDQQKKDMLAEATLPVDGLALDGDTVLYNGVPFDQCSSAQQLRVAVAMGIAANPDMRIMLIHEGSLLDDDNLAMIAEMAEAADFQVILERVSNDGEGCTVVIEDGEVKAADDE